MFNSLYYKQNKYQIIGLATLLIVIITLAIILLSGHADFVIVETLYNTNSDMTQQQMQVYFSYLHKQVIFSLSSFVFVTCCYLLVTLNSFGRRLKTQCIVYGKKKMLRINLAIYLLAFLSSYVIFGLDIFFRNESIFYAFSVFVYYYIPIPIAIIGITTAIQLITHSELKYARKFTVLLDSVSYLLISAICAGFGVVIGNTGFSYFNLSFITSVVNGSTVFQTIDMQLIIPFIAVILYFLFILFDYYTKLIRLEVR